MADGDACIRPPIPIVAMIGLDALRESMPMGEAKAPDTMRLVVASKPEAPCHSSDVEGARDNGYVA